MKTVNVIIPFELESFGGKASLFFQLITFDSDFLCLGAYCGKYLNRAFHINLTGYAISNSTWVLLSEERAFAFS